jgi:catechol 2,3-dioxygenase-like lactoylglutathione lyase family enzyme
MEDTMTTTDMRSETSARNTGTRTPDAKLEVVVLPVSDVDRATRFYQDLGWRLDAEFAGGEDFRVVQVTPPASPTSVIFGTGITSAVPGSTQSLVLAVQDIEAARAELVDRGVEVSEVFHDEGGVFVHAGTEGRVSGPDPKRGSYASWVSFSDPDGNGWLLQEVTTRLPGRLEFDLENLAELLRDAAAHHHPYEQSAPEHDWSPWYAAYMQARQNGSTQEEASSTAGRYMEEAGHVLSR